MGEDGVPGWVRMKHIVCTERSTFDVVSTEYLVNEKEHL